MSDTQYCNMLEIPVQSCNVVVKPVRRRKKDVKEEIIEKVNAEPLAETENVKPKRKPRQAKGKLTGFSQKKMRVIKEKKVKLKPEKKPVVTKIDSENETVKIESSKFDIISAQVVAIFVLIVGILLTNIFWEDSGMNNLFKTVFGGNSDYNGAAYSTFSAISPGKSDAVTIENGVMTISGGTVYAPCVGKIENIALDGDNYVVTVKHSDVFKTVISGIDFCYYKTGDEVFTSLPVGFSEDSVTVKMYDQNGLLTNYSLNDGSIVWQA